MIDHLELILNIIGNNFLMSKILILKNDRAGDLFTSLNLISTLLRDAKHADIYLSELNYS